MIWLWHALFDGTRLCRCMPSRAYRVMRNERERQELRRRWS